MEHSAFDKLSSLELQKIVPRILYFYFQNREYCRHLLKNFFLGDNSWNQGKYDNFVYDHNWSCITVLNLI